MRNTERYVREHPTDLATYATFGLVVYFAYKMCLAKPRAQGSSRVTVSGDNEVVENLANICSEEAPAVGQPLAQQYYPLWNPPTPTYDYKAASSHQMY